MFVDDPVRSFSRLVQIGSFSHAISIALEATTRIKLGDRCVPSVKNQRISLSVPNLHSVLVRDHGGHQFLFGADFLYFLQRQRLVICRHREPAAGTHFPY